MVSVTPGAVSLFRRLLTFSKGNFFQTFPIFSPFGNGLRSHSVFHSLCLFYAVGCIFIWVLRMLFPPALFHFIYLFILLQPLSEGKKKKKTWGYDYMFL